MSAESVSKTTAADFPIDVWHHIGKFVAPEDVGRFAKICRQTAFVTSTRPFWSNMYIKHVDQTSQYHRVPQELRREKVLAHRKGLRAKVIRALFYTHAPLQRCLQNRYALQAMQIPTDESPFDCLQKYQFSADLYSNTIYEQRYAQAKRNFFCGIRKFIPIFYYYLLKPNNVTESSKQQRRNTARKLRHIHKSQEIFYNPDESNMILFIKSIMERRTEAKSVKNHADVSTPTIESNVIESIHVQAVAVKKKSSCQLRNNVQYQDVTLKFQPKDGQQQTDIFNDVIYINIYKWWDPKFDKVGDIATDKH